jgi:hypothetical protein
MAYTIIPVLPLNVLRDLFGTPYSIDVLELPASDVSPSSYQIEPNTALTPVPIAYNYLGTPIYQYLQFPPIRYQARSVDGSSYEERTSPGMQFGAALVSVTETNRIRSTQRVGVQSGATHELAGWSGCEFNVQAYLFDPNSNLYPFELLEQFVQLKDAAAYTDLIVEGPIFARLGVSRVVLDSYTLPSTTAVNVQPIQFKLRASTPYQLDSR